MTYYPHYTVSVIRREKMTYSETREMYTSVYSTLSTRREKREERLLNALKLLWAWLLPWLLTSLSIVYLHKLYNAKGFLLSFVILALSFSFSLCASHRDRTYSIFWVVFSYLIALSSVLTVLL